VNLLSDTSTLRKLGNFLAAIFPSLGLVWDRVEVLLVRALRWCGATRLFAKARGTRLGAACASIVDRFYWGSYAGGRVDWARVPPEGAALLRAGFVLAAALCLSLPAAIAWRWPPLTLPDDRGVVAVWSVVVVGVATAAARALLLAGAAGANRFILVPVAWLDLYVAFGLLVCGGRSWLAVLAVLPSLVALASAEVTLRRPDRRSTAGGVAVALFIGVLAGELLAVMLPPSRGVGPIKLVVGAALGVPLGLGVRTAARRREAAPPVAQVAGVLFVLELLASVSAAARGGLSTTAGKDADLASLVGGFLWPIWYFVGVGVLFKLMGSTKTITGIVRDVVPGKRLVLLTPLLLGAVTLLLWAPAALDASVHLPAWALTAGAHVYKLERSLIWTKPGTAMAVEIFRWVALAAFAWSLVEAARRRLDTAACATLLFAVLLGWLASYEYIFEQLGFLREGPHTAAALFLFAVWLLWLAQKVGQLLGLGSSPRWPAAARLALFAGVLVLVMAQVHSRGAQSSPAFANEVFLLLYRSSVDVGVPYALYVWAGRKVPAMPVKTPALLAAFAAGGLLTLPLNALDRLGSAGGSFARLHEVAARHAAQILDGKMGAMFTDPLPPPAWTVARGLVAMALLALLGWWTERRRGEGVRASSVILVFAASAGLASFGHALVDIPVLPPPMTALIAPLRQTFELDAFVVGGYLVWSLPALAMALVATRLRLRTRWVVGLAIAVALHSVGAVVWPRYEPWLRSTGVLWTAGAFGVVAALWLVGQARSLVEGQGDERPGVFTRWAPGLAVLGLVGLAAWQGHAGRPIVRPVKMLTGALSLPAPWQQAAPPTETQAVFIQPGPGAVKTLLIVEAQDRPEGGARQALETALQKAQATLPAFDARRPTPGIPQMHVDGAALVDFSFEVRGPVTLYVSGTSLARDVGDKTVIVTWMGQPSDWARGRWDLPRVELAGAASP
jgi:hypothetical protein